MTTAATRDGAGRGGLMVAAAVAGFVLFALAGALVVILRPVTYRSLALVSIDQPSITDAAQAGVVAKLNHLRQLYGPLLDTTSITEPIAQATGLTATQVSDRVTVLVPKDSLLLGVRATGSTPAAAQRLAKAAADEIVQYAADTQHEAQVSTKDEIVLAVVSPAPLGGKATGTTRTVVTVAGFLGLLGGAAGIVLVARAGRPQA